MSTSHQFQNFVYERNIFMKATVLSDNIPAENLGCEWGLSIFIEYHGKHILLDAGASGLFLKNC